MNRILSTVSQSSLIQALVLMLLLCLLPLQQVRKPTAIFDQDIWWHLDVGDWVIQNHAVPHTGLFSQVGATRRWVAYSWGFEVTLALLNRWLGIKGLPIFVIAFGMIFTLMLFAILRKMTRSFWWAWLLTAAAIWSANLNLGGAGRPVTFSILFFTIELALVFRAQQTGDRKYLFWLLPLFILWANFHIQFIYGFLLPGLMASIASLDRWAVQRRLSWWPVTERLQPFRPGFLWGISAGCVLATIINPYGVGLYKTVLIYARTSTAYRLIAELQAPNFRDSAHYLELILVITAFFLLGRRGSDTFRFALMFLTSLLAFRAVKDSWFLCITAVMIIADLLPMNTEATDSDLGGDEGKWMRVLRFSAIVAGAICIVALRAADVGFNNNTLLQMVHNAYPVDAVGYIHEHRPAGPLFNNFNWGGFLMVALPEYPVAIDGRNDLYQDDLLEREVKTMVADGWASDPAVQRANLFLLPDKIPLCLALQQSPEFKKVYSDKLALVFVRVH